MPEHVRVCPGDLDTSGFGEVAQAPGGRLPVHPCAAGVQQDRPRPRRPVARSMARSAAGGSGTRTTLVPLPHTQHPVAVLLAEIAISAPVEYAAKIARDWNVKHSGAGYVTRFEVLRSFLDQYEVRQAGGKTILEYWIPAEDLAALNASIVGTIEVTAEYH